MSLKFLDDTVNSFTIARLLARYPKKSGKKIWEESHNFVNFSVDELEYISWQRTLDIFRYAYTEIPFYEKKYKAEGVEIGDIKTPEDFSKLPILTKSEIRESYSSMIAKWDSIENLAKVTTGGSTGEPLKAYRDPNLPQDLIMWPILERLGIKYSDSYGAVGRGTCSYWHNKLTNMFFFPRQYFILDASKVLDESNMRTFAESIQRCNAKYIVGYVGGIQEFANFCEKEGFTFPSLKAIWTSSAPLSNSVRAYLRNVFKCEAYTQYGSCELMSIAVECEKKEGMHIPIFARKVEILGDDGNVLDYGNLGRVIVTNLIDYRFPFIRYENGDKSSLIKKSCSCGLPLPLLDYVRGRVTDIIKLDDGSSIAGDYVTTIFDAYPDAVKAFQLVKKLDGCIVLRVVKNNHYSNASKEISTVFNKLKDLILPHCITGEIKYEEVSSIPSDKGKQRYVIVERN